jgi:gamma-glutamylcyclotransferase (GGCT)/AIG2-like uncharacterized protein YtfP
LSTFNLFVYGTLRGAGAGRLAGCERVADAAVTGTLYSIDGGFPALVHYGPDRVSGEVWRCPAGLLPELDEYEGVGRGMFRRIALDVETDDGSVVPCWLYAAGPALAHRLTPANRVAGGEWRP